MSLEYAEVDLSRINGTTTCKVCAKIFALFKMAFGVSAKLVLGKVSEVLASDCPHTEWVRNAEYDLGPIPHYQHRQLIAYKDANHTGVYLGVSFRDQEGSSYGTTNPFELVAREEPGHAGRSRILDPEWVDVDTICTWYKKCVQEHSLKCDSPTWMQHAEPVSPDWLIDTTEACIVPSNDDSMDYVSLSYTWGQTVNLRTMTCNLDKLRKPGALAPKGDFGCKIPKTIRHAIEITKLLGARYLWVDSLCIVQDDEIALHRSLEKMHMIYANSVLCIIAKAGHDADFGLRGIKGISSPRRAGQIVINLADGERLTGFGINRSPSCSSGRSYSERAWTFQEFMFAKRRLIFGHGLITWHCNCAGWDEELKFYAEADLQHRAVAREMLDAARWMNTRIPNLSDLTSVMQQFNQKVLTYPEDVLGAFSGIQSMLHRTYPGGLIFGVPEFFFDIALAWDNERDITRRHPSNKFKGEALKDNLPSWSWMGWRGETCFPWDMEFHPSYGEGYGYLEPVTKWFTMDSPIAPSRRPIESHWYEYKKASETSPESLVKGWTRTQYEPLEGQHLPKQLPQFVYKHDSDPEREFWYPVPVLDLRGAPEFKKQTQYLFCITTRAFLFASQEATSIDDKPGVWIEDRDGNSAGILYVPRRDDGELFKTGPRIELVAIARGWANTEERDQLKITSSQEIKDSETTNTAAATDDIQSSNIASIVKGKSSFSSDNQGSDASQEKENDPVSGGGQQSDTEVSDFVDSISEGSWWAQLDREREIVKENKEDCYSVLWIKWNNGVAYRQASGYVLSSMWEKYKEEEMVELILG